MVGYWIINDTRREIRHQLKSYKKKKDYEILNISEIKANKKNPRYCRVTITYRNKEKNKQPRARPVNEFLKVAKK